MKIGLKSWFLSMLLVGPLALFSGLAVAQSQDDSSCVSAFITLHGQKPGQLSSHEYMRMRLAANYSYSSEKWFSEYAEHSFTRALREKLAWQDYLENGLRDGERVIWIQQGRLKELNETLWDIGGTEYYLMNLDGVIANTLQKHPEWGRLIHRNYKDRVIVTSLSEEEFKEKVFGEVIKGVEAEISRIRSSLREGRYLWGDYIKDSLSFGVGESLEEAHFALKLQALGLNFKQWQEKVVQLRTELFYFFASKDIPWAIVLKKAKEYKGDIGALQTWLKSRGVHRKFAGRVIEYVKLNNVADFLPLQEVLSEADLRRVNLALEMLKADRSALVEEIPIFKRILANSWDFRRATFLRDLKASKHVVATDISGLGERAMLARDAYIEAGALPSKVTGVYDGTTRYLNEYYKGLHDELVEVFGDSNAVRLYASGDDALWGLPEMSPAQAEQVREIFAQRNNLYVTYKEIEKPSDPESVADSVKAARDELFELKPLFKEQMERQNAN